MENTRGEKAVAEELPPEGNPEAPRSMIAPRLPEAPVTSHVTWRVLRVLGVGGMAKVSLAEQWRDGQLERLVAIKRMHEHLAENEEFVRMFFDESRLASAVLHPNVVRVLDVYAREGEQFIVMEYVEGFSLARIMQRFHKLGERLPISFALRVMIDTLRGLHAAHEARDADGSPLQIIHRDVAPQNVLVSTAGVARITDFGVARAVGRLSFTAPGLVKGHLAYLAPEAVAGLEVTPRADVFASGVVLWELLSGRRLMAADSPAETLRNVTAGRIPPPEDVAPVLAAVCARALDRDPARRYPTARAFASALEDAATRLGLSLLRSDAKALVDDEMLDMERAKERASPSQDGELRAQMRLPWASPPHRSGSYAKTEQPESPPAPEPEVAALPLGESTLVIPSPPEAEDDVTVAEPGVSSHAVVETIHSREPAARTPPSPAIAHYVARYAVRVFAVIGLVYTLRELFALARRFFPR